VRAKVESETKARLDTVRFVSVSSARARSKKMSSGVGHQRRAMGRLDHAPSRFLSLNIRSELVAESMVNMLRQVNVMSQNVGLAKAGDMVGFAKRPRP
jgi:hypothetical protein